jgi:hypothetical protein
MSIINKDLLVSFLFPQILYGHQDTQCNYIHLNVRNVLSLNKTNESIAQIHAKENHLHYRFLPIKVKV